MNGNASFNENEFSQKICELHDFTGLSWSQVARLFDRSERTVQGWAAGHTGTVEVALVRAQSILDEVVALGLTTPAERLTAILTVNPSKPHQGSLFQKWRREGTSPSPILQFSSFQIFRPSETRNKS